MATPFNIARLRDAFRRIDGAFERAVRAHPFALPWSLGSGLTLLGYVWVFTITTDMAIGRTLATSIINVGTVWALGFAVLKLVPIIASRRPALLQLVAHGALAVMFTVVWYVCTISLLGWRNGSLLEGTFVSAFRGLAFVWQIFQGFGLYGAAAALAVMATRQQPDPVSVAAPVPEPRLERLLIRCGDEIRSVEVSDVVLIAAADDYSEIVTPTARHLARRSLAEFEAELPPSFVRVHRSTLVNLDRLVSAEPAGAGRMTLHLSGGESVIASRTGARLIRERIA